MLHVGWTRISWQKKDEFEAKQKELEGVVNPKIMKVYQAVGGGGDMPGGMPRGGFGGGGGLNVRTDVRFFISFACAQ